MSILAGSSTLLNRPILPSNQTPLGALPARFRRVRVLVVGCGDVGQRAARRLPPRVGVLALVRDADDPQPLIAEGVWPGTILHAPRGTGGFGYDPYFLLPEAGMTAAELDADRKNRESHRGQALVQLVERLKNRRA